MADNIAWVPAERWARVKSPRLKPKCVPNPDFERGRELGLRACNEMCKGIHARPRRTTVEASLQHATDEVLMRGNESEIDGFWATIDGA
jgi:hypothetical protein